MHTLTRENAKQHCRTCLKKLDAKNEATQFAHSAALDEGDHEVQEFKDIFINITTNSDLQQILAKYVDSKMPEYNQDYPPNLCLCCYNKLQGFEKFRKRAQESAHKLHTVLSNENVTKVEIDYDEDESSKVLNNEDDIYKLLLKDTLMETESVMLDNSTVATLTSVEMQIPDPFDTVTPASSVDENDDNYDWQKDEADAESPISNSSETDKINKDASKLSETDNDNDDDSDSEADSESDDEPLTRLRSGKTESDKKAYKLAKKKKRRTKKEMEEYRKAQVEKRESIIKRRNKGTKNSFKCDLCSHSFAHKLTLDAHVRKVHEGSKRPFQCDRCEKAYTFIGGLYTHIKEIHETIVRSYACDHTGCDRIYTSFIAMQKHKRVKHLEIGQQKKYVCEQCGATFNQTGNLKYHRRTKHPTEQEQAEKEKVKERFECDICKKQFHSRYTLKYHTLQLHTNDMKYECNICGRRMAKKFMLVQHMLVHSTEKMPCEHCGKQFIRKFELEAHIRAVHMKLKPFECQYCSECFASRKTLRHHEYIHTGEKPYVCDICGQAYRQQTCLKNHRKSHDKLSTEKLLAANINRTLMNTFMAPAPTVALEATLNLN